MKRLSKTLNRIFIRGSSHWLVDVRVNMSLHGRFVSGAKEFVNQLVDCACRALKAHIPLLLCRSALCIIPELSHQLRRSPRRTILYMEGCPWRDEYCEGSATTASPGANRPFIDHHLGFAKQLRPPEPFSSCHPGPSRRPRPSPGPAPPQGSAPPRPAASVFLPGRAGLGSRRRQQRGILGAASGCPRRRLGAKPCARPSRTLQGTALPSFLPPQGLDVSAAVGGAGRAPPQGAREAEVLGPRTSAVLRGCAGWDGTGVRRPLLAALLGRARAPADAGPAGRAVLTVPLSQDGFCALRPTPRDARLQPSCHRQGWAQPPATVLGRGAGSAFPWVFQVSLASELWGSCPTCNLQRIRKLDG